MLIIVNRQQTKIFFKFYLKMEKIKKKIKKYLLEIFLLSLALIITIISLIIIIQSSNTTRENEIEIIQTNQNKKTYDDTIYVDISGSVKNPGLYELKINSRLKNAIDKAGGLDENADKNFFYRNFNLARLLQDQEKIYIPSIWEVNNGYVKETPLTFDFISPINQISSFENKNNSLININNADIDELDTLPGIGKITAQKIIDNRPFQSIEELLTKKIINKSTFEKIKNLITIE